MDSKNWKKLFTPAVLIGTLGYFVDVYDLVLFSIVRIPSLKSLGLAGEELLSTGVLLLNLQMLGMLTGGIFFGILGDKRGRRSVLFSSILIYSLANLANAAVEDVRTYAILRFVAGFGLAGELGAAITLVSETLPQRLRGFGTAMVAGIGLLGAVFAGFLTDFISWRMSFAVGGGLGLLLLFFRVGLLESNLFEEVSKREVARGSLSLLFSSPERGLRYLCSILIGIPTWFVVGILMTFSPEITREMGIEGIQAGRSILFCYIGISMGDLASGFLSQWIGSRKKVVFLFSNLVLLGTVLYLIPWFSSLNWFYTISVLLGFAGGYWAVFVTMAAENFGTNLRSTVATTAPNFVRGSVVPLTILFQMLGSSTGLVLSSGIVGVLAVILANLSLSFLSESYGKNLSYVEEPNGRGRVTGGSRGFQTR